MGARARREGDAADVVSRHPAALAVLAPDGRIVYWNRAAEQLFGYPADEVAGQDYESLLVPSSRQSETRDALQQARVTGSACLISERLTRDGASLEVKVFLDAGTADTEGYVFVTQRALEQVYCRCGSAPQPGVRRPTRELTTRQLQVLRLIAEGRPTREIASRLGLSAKTVETHRGHLMQRLKLKSVAGLVRYAVSIGLVPSNPWALPARARGDSGAS